MKSALQLRHVIATDVAPLRAVRMRALATDPDAFGSTYERDHARPAEWWTGWAEDSETGVAQRTFVVDDGSGAFVGLALALLRDGGAYVELVAMWIAPEIRGQGWCASLCDACAQWAAERGAGRLELAVVEGNGTALRAYEAAGFSVTGHTTWSEAGRTLDELVMVRPLTPG